MDSTIYSMAGGQVAARRGNRVWAPDPAGEVIATIHGNAVRIVGLGPDDAFVDGDTVRVGIGGTGQIVFRLNGSRDILMDWGGGMILRSSCPDPEGLAAAGLAHIGDMTLRSPQEIGGMVKAEAIGSIIKADWETKWSALPTNRVDNEDFIRKNTDGVASSNYFDNQVDARKVRQSGYGQGSTLGPPPEWKPEPTWWGPMIYDPYDVYNREPVPTKPTPVSDFLLRAWAVVLYSAFLAIMATLIYGANYPDSRMGSWAKRIVALWDQAYSWLDR
ncbi:MAG: hypothetical protein HN976_31680 [Lentisphaerae bacterium]|jgi:hypothetical protein|nr:hypothetical protein [Lentisphaerota bacterium]MBT7059701.1 hypothetical protein [Lentisphaerota bacterium]